MNLDGEPFILYLTADGQPTTRALADHAHLTWEDGRSVWALLPEKEQAGGSGAATHEAYNAGQRREPPGALGGGRWTAGGGLGGGAGAGAGGGLPEAHGERVRLVKRLQAEMDLVAPMDVYSTPMEAQLSTGAVVEVAAVYSTAQQRVSVYAGAFAADSDETDLRSVLAHENTHYVYERVTDRLVQEDNRRRGDQRAGVTDQAYPVTAALAPFTSPAAVAQLRKEDGHTAYSAHFWQRIGPKGQGTDIAINETLAEIARTAQGGRGRAQDAQPSELWQQYYDAVHQTARGLRA